MSSTSSAASTQTDSLAQDPLVNVRQSGGEISVSLYGEVQKEVIAATLASDFGVDVTFLETTVIYIERVAGSGSHSGSTWTSARCLCTSTRPRITSPR